MADLEFQLKIYEELKQFQEHFVKTVDPKPVSEMTGNINFGSYLTVRVNELSDRTKNIIKQLVLDEMERSLYTTTESIEDIKHEINHKGG